MTERCEEIANQMEALKAHMLTKDDISVIAKAAAAEVDTIYAARFGRISARIVIWIFGAFGAGVLTWLTAHGYINGDVSR